MRGSGRCEVRGLQCGSLHFARRCSPRNLLQLFLSHCGLRGCLLPCLTLFVSFCCPCDPMPCLVQERRRWFRSVLGTRRAWMPPQFFRATKNTIRAEAKKPHRNRMGQRSSFWAQLLCLQGVLPALQPRVRERCAVQPEVLKPIVGLPATNTVHAPPQSVQSLKSMAGIRLLTDACLSCYAQGCV